MRYAGGGVGHYQVALNDPHSSESVEEPTEDVEMDGNLGGPVDPSQAAELGEDEDMASEDDSNSDSSSGEDGEDGGVDHGDLPEDGEGGFIDAEDEEGYAEL